MGWFCESSTTPTTSTTTSQIPAWYEDALQRLVAGGEEEVAAQPYQYYDPSRRVAPLSATEEAAIAATPMAAGAYMPGLRSAYNAATLGTRSLAQPRRPVEMLSTANPDPTYGISLVGMPPGYADPAFQAANQQFFRDRESALASLEGQATFPSGSTAFPSPQTKPRPIMDFMGPREGDGTPAGLGDVSSMRADLGAYMNPYTQYVTDVAKREAIRDYGKMRPQMGFNASRQGAFGGARYGVEEAEAQRNLGQRLSDIETKGLESAFTAGTGLFEKEAGRQLQASPLFANIGAQAQNLGLSGLDAIIRSQAIPRGLEDRIRDMEYQETMRGQGYGMNQLAGLSGLIRGIQPGGSTTTQGQVPTASPIQNIAGLGLAGAGIYNLLRG